MTKGHCRAFRLWRSSSTTKQLCSWWSFVAVTWASTTWQFFYLNPLNQVTAIFTAYDMHMVSYLCPSIFQERVQPLPNSQSRSWWLRTRVLGQPFSWLQHTCTGTNFKQLCRINTKHGMQIANQATEKLSNWAGKKPEVPKATNPLWLLEGNLLLPTFIPSIWNVTDSPCRRKHKKWKSMQ